MDMAGKYKVDVVFNLPNIPTEAQKPAGVAITLLNPMDEFKGNNTCGKTGASGLVAKSMLSLLSSFVLIVAVLN